MGMCSCVQPNQDSNQRMDTSGFHSCDSNHLLFEYSYNRSQGLLIGQGHIGMAYHRKGSPFYSELCSQVSTNLYGSYLFIVKLRASRESDQVNSFIFHCFQPPRVSFFFGVRHDGRQDNATLVPSEVVELGSRS